jgi:hypothetical protein
MYAADDVSAFPEVLRPIREKLQGGAANFEDVVSAVTAAYRLARKARFERVILNDCLMTHEEFLQHGLERLGEAIFTRKLYEMDQMGLGMQLLIAGFDDASVPHIMSCDSFGRVTLHDALSFHAIGAGDFAALGSLHRNDKFRFSGDIEHIAHRLMEAKYCAETCTAVGKQRTIVVAFFSDGKIRFTFSDIDAVRDAWEWQRQQEPEGEVLEAITSALISPDDALRAIDGKEVEDREPAQPS